MNSDFERLEMPVWQHETPPDLISGRVCVIWYMDDYEFGMWSAVRQDWLVYEQCEWNQV